MNHELLKLIKTLKKFNDVTNSLTEISKSSMAIKNAIDTAENERKKEVDELLGQIVDYRESIQQIEKLNEQLIKDLEEKFG